MTWTGAAGKYTANRQQPQTARRDEADRSAALLAQRTARTDAQRAAAALRLADIRAREAALTPAE